MEEMPGRIDDALVRRWQQGDCAAFAALVRRWQQPMARFLARLAGRPDPVADLCQEVFLRVFLAGPRYRESGRFAAWLYRIALNVARDAARRQRGRPVPLDDPVADSAGPSELLEREEATRLVDEALQALPGPLREVLVLRHYEGMSFEAMSRVLGAPASTLKSRFAVALDRLRLLLQQRGWPVEENQ